MRKRKEVKEGKEGKEGKEEKEGRIRREEEGVGEVFLFNNQKDQSFFEI